MGHHGHHHGHNQEQQSYGAGYGPYAGSSSGYYESPQAPAYEYERGYYETPQAPAYEYQQGYYETPQAPAYEYQQPEVGYGGYGYAEQPVPYGRAVQPYEGGYGSGQPSQYGAMQGYPQSGGMERVNYLVADEHKHKKHEHTAEAVALGAAAFAVYEHHEVKADPEHAARHRQEEHMAEAVALGAGGYALYEHQQARHDHQQLQAAGYYPEHGHHNKHEKKHHHGLFS